MVASTSVRVLRTAAVRSARGSAARSGPRSMATSSRASSSSSSSSSSASSSWWIPGAAALAGVAAAAAAATLSANRSPLALDSRRSFSDRMKPRESAGDEKLKQEAHDHKQPEAQAAKETPDAIEVAAEEAAEPTEQQSAYDPETGEINWDCPCLGGMAHGPCGEQFKAAFSCFVYSEAEPKGIDCVDKFKAMQDCFREYPEIYKDEIEDDEAAQRDMEDAQQQQKQSDDGDNSEGPKREKNAAVGGDRKEGGPARSGTATVEGNDQGGVNPDKVDNDDPERKKREHDVFANRASSGATPRG